AFEVRDTSFAIVGLADTFVTIDLLNNPIIMQSDTVQWHVVANSYLPPMSLASREVWTFINWNEAVSQIPEIVSSFGLGPVYPNPFNSSTTITYDVNAIADVRLEVFSIEGRLVETLVAAERWPGRYTARWNGTSNGYAAGSGTYFVRLTAGSQVSTKKLILLR
ncbi:T9SS type A sorting domain-containing protein, partial [bacterium]|nr:T9SS type A sorting domain-containing protein [bacterium]